MKDNFSSQADLYALYRPVYPKELFEFILSQVGQREAAWDCATGNGQTAAELARSFTNIYATDISQRQLDHAVQAPNIIYTRQPAEQTSFENDSFDLITVSQALHWFRFNEFYNEVKRVGKHGGVIAAWAYSLLTISPVIDELVRDYHFNTLKDYWDEERKYVDDGYQSIPFPFEQIVSPQFFITNYWSLQEMEGYLRTWSALQKFMKVNGNDPIKELIDKLREYWPEEKAKIVFPVHLKLGRIK
ncbi:MAG TPA: class I SAM-dependent methyltransferase [Chitinophagaceae bacterium]|nr:class I SAM-dependent methyltransferase [Chitinophagaceae bacterium]